MKLNIEAIHHVGLVVRDREAVERLYVVPLDLLDAGFHVGVRDWYSLRMAPAGL
jgi:hypothetical protein